MATAEVKPDPYRFAEAQQVWFGRRQAPAPAAATVVEAETPPAPRLPPGAAIAELRSLCLGEMDPTSLAKLTPEELTQEVERTLAEIATQRRIQLNGREQRALARELVNDMLGLGPLEPLLEDDSITDIMVNGPEKVFVERRGKLDLSGVRFRDASHVAHVCQRIAARVGRRIDESTPMVDARLKDGSRVNIVFPPLAL
ncbi:MAG TPA: ATPase, T2SS/T4P/T4SS family, partial [Acetobacteraceae bacterium]|nr:ATPase, T2SS/T4P/T4SS family [Acetobacteraceae bacterium]